MYFSKMLECVSLENIGFEHLENQIGGEGALLSPVREGDTADFRHLALVCVGGGHHSAGRSIGCLCIYSVVIKKLFQSSLLIRSFFAVSD